MKKIFGIIFFIIWCFAAIYGAMHHEIWRDEMRALSIAIESPSFLQLPAFLINEGHPILWYFLLKVSYLIFKTTYVLPILSLLFATAIAWFLLIRSPLPLILSLLIIFGSWCLYEYGINCRNYGIAAFLFLLFADVKTRKPESILAQSFILAIAAQANIYAAMMAICIIAWLLLEAISKDINLKKTILGLGIIAVSILFVFYVTLPGTDSLVLVKDQQKLNVIFKIWNVGHGFNDLLYGWFSSNRIVTTCVLWFSLLVFIPKPKALMVLATALLIMSFFCLYFRMNFIQHQGIWIYTYLVMLWINYKDIHKFFVSKNWIKFLSYAGLAGFSFILISNIARAKADYMYDLNGLRSDSKDAGKWFSTHIKKDDIIISEPDYMMESAMYYCYHPFYLPREKVFNTFVHFTKANAEIMTLKKLNQIADSFASTGKTTYLILGKNFEKDTVYKYSYNKKYIVDSASLAVLKNNYQLMDSFNNNWYCDEHYFIYKLKEKQER